MGERVFFRTHTILGLALHFSFPASFNLSNFSSFSRPYWQKKEKGESDFLLIISKGHCRHQVKASDHWQGPEFVCIYGSEQVGRLSSLTECGGLRQNRALGKHGLSHKAYPFQQQSVLSSSYHYSLSCSVRLIFLNIASTLLLGKTPGQLAHSSMQIQGRSVRFSCMWDPVSLFVISKWLIH